MIRKGVGNKCWKKIWVDSTCWQKSGCFKTFAFELGASGILLRAMLIFKCCCCWRAVSKRFKSLMRSLMKDLGG